jgi:hypothetical protein
MKNQNKPSGITFEVDRTNLYREEAYTDLKSASVRKLIPVRVDGTVDESRQPLFFGHAELISPQGPIPVQAELWAETLEGAFEALPAAMQKAAEEVRRDYDQMMAQRQQQAAQQSKVIHSGGE